MTKSQWSPIWRFESSHVFHWRRKAQHGMTWSSVCWRSYNNHEILKAFSVGRRFGYLNATTDKHSFFSILNKHYIPVSFQHFWYDNYADLTTLYKQFWCNKFTSAYWTDLQSTNIWENWECMDRKIDWLKIEKFCSVSYYMLHYNILSFAHLAWYLRNKTLKGIPV